MSYWVREIAGWVLIVAGLGVFLTAFFMLLEKRIFEAAPLTFIGFIVFRGGIHVLKVAVAAQAARNVFQTVNQPPRRPGRTSGRPIGPTPTASVVPGPQSSVRRREQTARRE